MTREEIRLQVDERAFAAAMRTWEKALEPVRLQVSKAVSEQVARELFFPVFRPKHLVYREIRDEVDRMLNL